MKRDANSKPQGINQQIESADRIEWIRSKLKRAEQSGVTYETKEQILAYIKKSMKLDL